MEVMPIHRDDIVNGVSMHTCRNMVTLSWQCQIAAGDASPHIDGQMIAHFVAEDVGCRRINIRYTRECKVLVHTGHVEPSCSFRQKLEQRIERSCFSYT